MVALNTNNEESSKTNPAEKRRIQEEHKMDEANTHNKQLTKMQYFVYLSQTLSSMTVG